MDLSKSTQVELSDLLGQLCEKIHTPNDAQELERGVEAHVQAIRHSFARLSRNGKNDVFACYLMDKLAALASVFTEAATQSVLRVTDHEFTSAQRILNAFGEGKKVYRFTWRIDPSERLFDDQVWKRHFELSSAMAMAGELDIRTLMIVESAQVCETPNIEKLLQFYASNVGLDARIVLAADWAAWARNHALSSTCIEFGIFGEALLYQADSYSPVPAGNWSKDLADIKRFTRLFDLLWIASDSLSAGALGGEPVTLSQLMDVDSSHERRKKNAVHDSVARIESRMATAAP